MLLPTVICDIIVGMRLEMLAASARAYRVKTLCAIIESVDCTVWAYSEEWIYNSVWTERINPEITVIDCDTHLSGLDALQSAFGPFVSNAEPGRWIICGDHCGTVYLEKRILLAAPIYIRVIPCTAVHPHTRTGNENECNPNSECICYTTHCDFMHQ
jgi:hypothetical protein